jgi:hypothetical protein
MLNSEFIKDALLSGWPLSSPKARLSQWESEDSVV